MLPNILSVAVHTNRVRIGIYEVSASGALRVAIAISRILNCSHATRKATNFESATFLSIGNMHSRPRLLVLLVMRCGLGPSVGA